MTGEAIGLTLAVGICYLILTVFMPALFLYKHIKHLRFVIRIAVYQVAGNLWLTAIGYLFSFLNIWNELLVLMVTIVVPLLIKIFVFRRDLLVSFRTYVDDKRAKLVTSAGTIRNLAEKTLNGIKTAFYRYIRYHYIEIIILVLLAVFAVWYYGYFKLHNMTYASSDEATHLYWINALFGREPFPAGLYPHSMHFVIAAIHSISGMQTLVINHYFSVVIMLMVHFMLFCTAKVLFRSAAAAIGTSGLFLLADMFIAQRYQNTLPMEFGIIPMMCMIIFLTEFAKHRNKFYMWMAALATGWSFHAHFYVTIICIMIWAAFILVYLKTIIRLKAVARTLLMILLSAVIAVTPFVIGFAAGHPFEQSIGWAMGIMGVSEESNDTLRFMLYGGNEEESSESASKETADSPEETEQPLTEQQQEFMEASTPGEYLRAAEHLLTVRLLKDEKSALTMFVLIFLAFVYGIGEIIWLHLSFRKKNPKKELVCAGEDTAQEEQEAELKRKKREYGQKKQEYIVRNGLTLVVPLMIVFGLFLTVMSYLGLPEIIDDSRAAMIIAPVTALLFAIPIKLAEDLLKLLPVKNKKAVETVLLLAVGGGLGFFYAKGPVKQLNTIGCYAVTQELSNKLTYDLIASHEPNTWTVISPVNDLLAVRYHGYHYEIIDLLMEIEDGEESIYMPAKDLYVVAEKKTMFMAGVYYLPNYHQGIIDQSLEQGENLVDLNFYDLGLPWLSAEEAYTNYRNVTMTKFTYWMEEIKKAYPNEVEVYSEDEVCVVYHIRQSEDFPLNLAVDYRINNRGVNSRDDFIQRYAQENGISADELSDYEQE